MSQHGETEKERLNLSVPEFAAQLKATAQEVRELVKLARKVGSLKSGQHFQLKDGSQFGAKELNAATTKVIRTLKQLKKNYTARGSKKKRSTLTKEGVERKQGKGFAQGSFLEKPLVDFLRNANFGNVPGTSTPLRDVLKPVLDNNVLSRSILTPLLTIYEFHNGLRFEEGGKKYFRAGPEMERYLGPYLTALERADAAKTDQQMLDKKGKPKMRFNRNKFVYNRLQSIVNPGVKPQSKLTDQQRAWIELPEVVATLGDIQKIVSAALEAAEQ
jgi:hypothetical protein